MPEIQVPYFLSLPASGAPREGVVVIHEGNGMSPQLLRVCERLADQGYGAIAPDLFWRFGGSDPNNFMDHLRDLRLSDVVDDLRFAVGRIRELGAGPVGVTGFCMGGKFTYLAAVSGLDVQCAAPFYGSGISELDGDVQCPLLAFYGGRDEYVPMEEIEKVRARHPGDVIVYPDAEHGFMRDGSETYHQTAAPDAWGKLLAFLAQHLRGVQPE
ncbi:MAG TPA: dienelactone hydrolase family protein [Acidimicrobiia bacterium]|nr:dienelactone hydrolase family protein [Acidimicrobiia bacterium]